MLDFIIRKTYGFNKKDDAIALSQFCLGTGLKKNTVCRAIAHLLYLNLITKKENDVANVYRFNKDFDSWKPLPKKRTFSKKRIIVTKKENNRTPKRDIQKTVTKDTITKDTTPIDDIQKVFGAFFDTINPNINFGNVHQRKEARWLIEHHGIGKILNAIAYLGSIAEDRYAPTITNPAQLREKMSALVKYKVGHDRETNSKKGFTI